MRIIDRKDLSGKTEQEAKLYESRVTRKYIEKYGIDNFRGGDLSYSGKLVQRIGRYFDRDSWELFVLLVFFMLVIALFILDKYGLIHL